MARSTRRLVLGLMTVLTLALLAMACSKAEEAAPAPAPAVAPSPTQAPAVAPAPVAAPTPAPAAAPAVQAQVTSTAPALEAGTKLDPRTIEPGSTFPQETIKFHHFKMPLWEKAQYGGERVGTSAYNPTNYNNPFFNPQKRNVFGGMLIMIDAGTCSSIGRTDFSRCNGVRNNTLAGVLVPGILEK